MGYNYFNEIRYLTSISFIVIEFRYQHLNTRRMKMQDPILRKLFLGFIQIHILHHAKNEPVYGSFMIEELKTHGYDISPGTLYPIFHNLEKAELLTVHSETVNGKVRKYYSITPKGTEVLTEAKKKARELTGEL